MKPSRLLLALIGGLLALAIVLGSLPLLGIKLPQTLQPIAPTTPQANAPDGMVTIPAGELLFLWSFQILV